MSRADGEGQDWHWHREPGTGDDMEQVWTCCGGPYDERPHGHYSDCPRPAAPAAEAGDELRAEMARKLYTWVIGVAHENAWNCADALLNLPALQRLVEQAATLARVEALILQWETRDVRLSRRFAANELRRALDGTDG